MQAEGDVIRSPATEKAPPGFAAFFAGEHARLFKALYLVTGNRADAAELMQDAFLKLWERWDRIDRIDDPTGYLFRVALNGFRMRTRAAIRATRRLVPVASTTDPGRRHRGPAGRTRREPGMHGVTDLNGVDWRSGDTLLINRYD